jgi:hypothetical protein
MHMNLALILACLALVETGGHPRPGPCGEVGAYQLSPAALADGMSPEARLRWLARELPRHGLPVSEYTLAMSWHAPQRTFHGTFTAQDVDYATRVRNLYYANHSPRSPRTD